MSATQQYLINQAQMQANNLTQQAMNEAYDVVNELEAYNMMQEAILAVQLTTLAYQMYATVQQLCQSYGTPHANSLPPPLPLPSPRSALQPG